MFGESSAFLPLGVRGPHPGRHAGGAVPDFLEIAFAQDADVVRHVARHHEAEGEDGEREAAGGAAPRPRILLQAAKEVDAGLAYVAELLDVGDPRTLIRRRSGDGDVLIEAGKRRVQTAGEPESAHHEDAFRVVEMAEHLANAP